MQMFRGRSNYWSCSELSRKLQAWFGVSKKPWAATMDDWEEWEIANRSKFGWWLTEVFLDKVQDVVMFPQDLINSIKIYANNRFVTKTHYLKTGLKRGQWYDTDTRMLHGMFNTLGEFIAQEEGWMEWAWVQDLDPWGWRLMSFDEKLEYGLKHLKSTAALRKEDDPDVWGDVPGPTPQALAAQEAIDLWEWWVGYDKDWNDDQEIENEMLIRLIKVRGSLWT